MSTKEKLTVDEKLALDVFEVDKEPFITVRTDICRSCELKPCLYVCPAQVYRLEKDGDLVYNIEGCLEMGACNIACHNLGRGAIDWKYPRGGLGVQFRYG